MMKWAVRTCENKDRAKALDYIRQQLIEFLCSMVVQTRDCDINCDIPEGKSLCQLFMF